MVEAFLAQTAFRDHLASVVPASDAGVIVSERANYALAIVMARRGKQAELAERASGMGMTLPVAPARHCQGSLAFIGMGPDRWLATLDNGATPKNGDDVWAKSLERDLAGYASVTDQTDGYAVLRIGGPKARAMLAKGVAIDLHPRVFRAGNVAITQIAHMGVMLWQLDERPTYEIAVFRSLAGSFWHWLSTSTEEFGLAIEDGV